MEPIPPSEQQGLAPGLLVSSPGLEDPNFSDTLVLMVEHGEHGAVGFVVNRPSRITVGEVLASLDDDLAQRLEGLDLAGCDVLWGGPVQPEALWVLHPRLPGVSFEDAVPVGDRFAIGASREILDHCLAEKSARPFHLLLGYAGWGPLQVEQETVRGTWLPLPLQDDLLFEVDYRARWEVAVRRLGLTPGGFLVGGPGAQA